MSDRIPRLMAPGVTPPGPDCLSDLALDRVALDELAPSERSAAATHLAACERCRSRAAVLASTPELDDVARARMLAGIGAGLRRGAPAAKRRWAAVAGIAAIAASLVLAVVIPRGLEPSGTALKGGAALTIYRERGGEVVTARPGDRMRPGDRLRFEVSLPGPGEILVAGRDPSGAIYAAYPAEGPPRSRRHGEGGPRELLPGAIELDGAIGAERFELVFCSRPFALEQLREAPPEGCQRDAIEVEKVP